MELKDKKLYLLDMDGTLYLGDRLFPDTQRFLSMITARGGGGGGATKTARGGATG